VHRRVVVLVYVALFVGELSWQGVTPLIPSYVSQYDLTDLEGGLLLASASLGILLASLPAGYLTRHVNPWRLTILAMALIACAAVATAYAPSYVAALAARFVFGVGFGALWVSVPAWLDDASGVRSAQVLAGTTTIVGIGGILGPAYAGAVAQRLGLGAPFLGIALVTFVLLVLLLLDRSGTGRRREAAPPLRDLARAAGSDPDLVTMLALTVAASLVWMTADLLVPLRLGAAGFDAGAIGAIFLVGSLAFVLASAITSRFAHRLARPSIVATATALLAASTLVPALLPGVTAALVFLVGAALTTGVTIALTFPFGLKAVARGAVTVAVMSALSSIIWATSGLVGPTAGGAFSEWAGDQAAFGVLTVVCVLVAVVVARQARGPRGRDIRLDLLPGDPG
jgi:MFS family permease